MALAEEIGNVSAACRMMGVHRSTYYRWRGQVERHGLEMLRPRERRHPQMPNRTPHWIEDKVVAFALAHAGFGPQRIADELARPCWGRLAISSSGVYRILRRRGLNTRAKRLSLVAGHAAPPEPGPRPAAEPQHLDVDRPGELVQFDCFRIGKLAGTGPRLRTCVWIIVVFTSRHEQPNALNVRYRSSSVSVGPSLFQITSPRFTNLRSRPPGRRRRFHAYPKLPLS
jgi:transposase